MSSLWSRCYLSSQRLRSTDTSPSSTAAKRNAEKFHRAGVVRSTVSDDQIEVCKQLQVRRHTAFDGVEGPLEYVCSHRTHLRLSPVTDEASDGRDLPEQGARGLLQWHTPSTISDRTRDVNISQDTQTSLTMSLNSWGSVLLRQLASPLKWCGEADS